MQSTNEKKLLRKTDILLEAFRNRKPPSQKRLKYTSFKFFSVLIAFVAFVNYLSPCNGRGGNLFTIMYQKILGTYNNGMVFDPNPLSVEISNMEILDESHVSLDVLFSHVGKISCTVADSLLSAHDVSFNETNLNRVYIPTALPKHIVLDIPMHIGQTQRLYCRMQNLVNTTDPILYHASSPFIIRYKNIRMNLSEYHSDKEVEVVLFPQDIHVQYCNESSMYEPGNLRLVCMCGDVMDLPSVDVIEKSTQLFKANGLLPLQLKMNIPDSNTDFRISCIPYVINGTSNMGAGIVSSPLSLISARSSLQAQVLVE